MRKDAESLEFTLRATAILSGDTAPQEVAAYLRHLAKFGSEDAKKQVYDDCLPLVRTLPQAYVDFLLEILLQREKKILSSIAGPSPDDEDEFDNHSDYYGTSYRNYDLDRAAYYRGPFLALLRCCEDEGLRFIWTYTNTLTERWRHRVAHPNIYSKYRHSESRTPIPLILDLPSQTLTFWGDAQVYLWPHDTNHYCPRPLVSALLALEYWIEEQIEGGREAWPLIEKVLSGSRCVAVLGLCFGVLLAYEERALPHMQPFVANNRLWRLEKQRSHHQQEFAPMAAHPQGENPDRSDLKNRDRRPQRWREMCSLAMHLKFGDDEYRKPFEDAVRLFPNAPLPFYFEEERGDAFLVEELGDLMEEFAAFTDRSFYQLRQVSDGVGEMQVMLPPHIEQKRRERTAFLFEPYKAQALVRWARQGIESKSIPSGLAIQDAVAEAKALGQPDDFSYAYEWRLDMVNARHEAQAVVAALLAVVAWEWACDNGHARWCLDILRRATYAPLPHDGSDDDGREAAVILLDHPKIAAAHGWSALAVRAENQGQLRRLERGRPTVAISLNAIRRYLLYLASLNDREVWMALLRGLTPLWDRAGEQQIPPHWVWAFIEFAVAMAVRPQFEPRQYSAVERVAASRAWKRQMRQRVRRLHKRKGQNDCSQSILPLPHSSAEPGRILIEVLETLPVAQVVENPVGRKRLVRLLDYMIQWMVESHMRPWLRRNAHDEREDAEPVNINRCHQLLRWCVAAGEVLTTTEAEPLIVQPILQVWEQVPELTEELLLAHVTHWIRSAEEPSPVSQHMWRALCNRVLQDARTLTASRWSSHRSIEEAAAHIVFSWAGECWLGESYPHAKCFVDVIHLWVKRVGCREIFFPHLLALLESQSEGFWPQPALGWLQHCLQHDTENQARRLLKEGRDASKNAHRVARLLHFAGARFGDEIHADTALRQQFLELLEPLIAVGQPSAALMRSRIADQRNS